MKEMLQEWIKLQDVFASITEDEARKAFPIIGKVIGDEGYDLFAKFCRNINVQSVLDSFIECNIQGTEALNGNFILDGIKAILDATYLACFTENVFLP